MKLGNQPKNVEQLSANYEVTYTWPVFPEGCHQPCRGSWPILHQLRIFCIPLIGGMWMDFEEQQGSHKDQDIESQNKPQQEACHKIYPCRADTKHDLILSCARTKFIPL